MNSYKRYKATIWNIAYCSLWTILLFGSSSYAILSDIDNAFIFTGVFLSDAVETHIFPVMIAFAIYLLDIAYANYANCNFGKHLSGILVCIMMFILLYFGALMVNDNTIGWRLYLAAWLALAILKFLTTEQKNLHTINEN